MFGHVRAESVGLVTANSDVIGLTGFPTAPLLIQSGPGKLLLDWWSPTRAPRWIIPAE